MNLISQKSSRGLYNYIFQTPHIVFKILKGQYNGSSGSGRYGVKY